jgi:uncharacterized membrane protein YccC
LTLAIMWPRTNSLGFVGGIVLSILIGMPVRHVYGELTGTLTILVISGLTVWIGAILKPQRFDISSLRSVKDTLAGNHSTADSALPVRSEPTRAKASI